MTISKSSNKSRITINNILNESKNHIIDDIENNEEFFITYFDIPENNNELTKYYTKTEEIDDTNITFIDNIMNNKKLSVNFSKKQVKIVKK
jgi:hypothetical protein